jgi:H+-transporting ATPase
MMIVSSALLLERFNTTTGRPIKERILVVQSKDIAGIENTYTGLGLNDADVQARQKQYGYNEVTEKQTGPVTGTLKRMWGPVPWLLEAAMIFEFFMGKVVQSAVVFLLLVFSAVIGEIQEQRAKKAIGYLHQQLQINVRTLRNGTWKTIPSRELVPGELYTPRLGILYG